MKSGVQIELRPRLLGLEINVWELSTTRYTDFFLTLKIKRWCTCVAKKRSGQRAGSWEI